MPLKPVQFENEVLLVDLPQGWADCSGSEDEFKYFANAKTREDLVIELRWIPEGVDIAELAKIVEVLAHHRVTALAQFSAGQFTVLEGTQATNDARSEYIFSGLDTKNSVYSKSILSGHLSHVVTVHYYLHRYTAVSADIVTRANTVFAMCRSKVA